LNLVDSLESGRCVEGGLGDSISLDLKETPIVRKDLEIRGLGVVDAVSGS
jgi:hypothetical protein